MYFKQKEKNKMTDKTFKKELITFILKVATITYLIILALIISSCMTACIIHTIRNEILEAPRITEKQ